MNCIQCGNEHYLIELENGKYGCKDCLDVIGNQQSELEQVIKDSFKKHEIEKIEHQINALDAVKLNIMRENGLLSKKDMKKIRKSYARMMGKGV